MKKNIITTISFFLLIFNISAQVEIKELIEKVDQAKRIEDLNALESKIKNKDQLTGEIQLIIDYKKYDFVKNPIKSLEILFELTNSSNSFSNPTKAWANYYLSEFLIKQNISQEGIHRNKLSCNYAKKADFIRIETQSNSLLAGYYYTIKEFQKAISFYKKCLFNDNASKASNYNNMALSYMCLNKNDLAFHYYNLGIKSLRNPKSNFEKEIFYLLKGNIGTLYFKKSDFKNAEIYFKEEYEYYENILKSQKKIEFDMQNYIYSIQEMIKLKSYRRQDYSLLFEKMIAKVMEIKEVNLQYEVINNLKNKLLKYLSQEEINRLLIIQSKIQEKYIKNENTNKNYILKLLYEDKLISLKKTVEYEHNQNYLSKRNNQFKSILIIFLIGGLILLAVLFVKNQRHRKFQQKHELIMNKQKEELYETNQRLLQNEINNSKDQLQQITIGLKIKKETEENLLSKIKVLKKKPNASIEMVINEIYFGIQNLTNIDKKLFVSQNENSNDIIILKNKLNELHPELSKKQIEFCNFCLLGLSSKEIGHITGQSDGAVRVYKSKIKVKIGLNIEDDLQEYLNKICGF